MFVAWRGGDRAAVAVLQSIVHLEVVLRRGHVGTIVDLDRSNSLPDLVSTVALAAAAARLPFSSARGRGAGSVDRPAVLAGALALLTLADLVHDGPHPASAVGWLVIAVVVATGASARRRRARSGVRARATLAAAGCAARRLVPASTRSTSSTQRFERERGDPIAEYQIVAKEGLELLGWSLVALALWDEALRRRRAPHEPSLQRELLEHGLHRDDVALEAELRVLEARGDADQLREVEDRHLEVLAGLLLELRLPCVE